MKKGIILVALVSAWAVSQAQKSQLFKQRILPNHTYSLTSKQEFDVDAIPKDSTTNADTTKAPKSVQLRSVYGFDASVKTAALTASKNFPVTMTCNNITSKANVNGQNYPFPPTNPAVGQSIDGRVDPAGNFQVDTATADGALKQVAQGAIGHMPKQIKFPATRMKIGDSFMQEEYIGNFDIPGFDPTKEYMMKVKYKLTAIKNNLAYFDTTSEFAADFNKEVKGHTISVKSKGAGNGKMVFDISKEFPQSITRELNLAVAVGTNKTGLDAKIKLSHDDRFSVSSN